MKTILVPTEDNYAMGSALEGALILGRRCDSYALHRATTLGDCSAEIFEQCRAHERLE